MFESGKEPENLMRKSLPDEQLRIVARELAYFKVNKKLPNGIISEHLLDQVGSLYWKSRKEELKRKTIQTGKVNVDGEMRDSELSSIEGNQVSISDVPGLVIEALTLEILERYARGK